MGSELESLVIRLEADTTLLRRALKDAESGVDSFQNKANSGFSNVEKRYQQAGANLEASMKRIASAIAATATVAAAWDLTKQAASIDGLAKSAGLSTDTFQDLRNVAASTGVEFDKFDASTKQFGENMGELRTRTGGFYEFLTSAAPRLQQQLQATKSQSEAYNVLAGFVASMAKSEEQALIVKKAFGDSSPDFIAALEKMAAGYDTAGKAASDFGGKVSKEAIANTKALKKEIDDVTNSFSAFVQEIIGRVAPSLVSATEGLRAKSGEFFKDVGAWANGKTLAPWAAGISETAKQTAAIQSQTAAIGSWVTTTERAKNVRLEQKLPPWQTSVDTSVADKLSALRSQSAQARGEDFEQIRQETEQQIEEVRRMMTNDITGRLNDEKEFNEARVLINEAAAKRIADANQKLVDDDRQKFSEMENVIKGTWSSAIDEAVRTGKVSWSSLVTDMLSGIARVTTEMLVLKPIMDSVFSSVRGSGFLSGLFNFSTSNNGFGGGRAAGGPVLGNVPHLVGEQGPELFVPNTSGSVIPAGSFGGGGGSSVTYNIDARGADISVAERVEAAIAAAQRGQRSALQSVAAQRQRFPVRAVA